MCNVVSFVLEIRIVDHDAPFMVALCNPIEFLLLQVFGFVGRVIPSELSGERAEVISRAFEQVLINYPPILIS